MRRKLLILFSGAVVLLCMLPTVSLLLGYEGQNYENRPLARMPKLMDGKGLNLSFPDGFDNWFQDHFGLREEMVTAFHSAAEAAFKDSLNEDVIIGKEDMLFFGETLPDYLGTDTLSDHDIARAARIIRIQQEYVEAKGMTFAFTLAPNKNTVYPEYMPDRLAPTGLPSNRERLAQALEKQGVNYIDLAAVLTAAKDEGLLYHYHDTHWNETGALVGYRAIMENIWQDGYQTYEDVRPVIKTGYAGDLHYFLFPAEEGNMPYPYYGISYEYQTDPSAPGNTAAIGTTSAANDRRLLLYRDSFGDGILPMLSANHGRVLYSAEFPYNYFLLDSEQPDAVVIELVERNIRNLLTRAPALPAMETGLSGQSIGRVKAAIAAFSRNGYTVICGAFAGEYSPDAERILLKAGDSVYEAFPILDEQAEYLADDGFIHGFCLTLPEGCAAETFTLIIENAEGYRESGELSVE